MSFVPLSTRGRFNMCMFSGFFSISTTFSSDQYNGQPLIKTYINAYLSLIAFLYVECHACCPAFKHQCVGLYVDNVLLYFLPIIP